MALPPGITVFERGWLSANNILFTGGERNALVDSGYWTHSTQTVALVEQALHGRPLDQLLNTHLHSDHCGGNAALQDHYPEVHTAIPPGLADAVRRWDPVTLTYEPTGQHCPRFHIDGLLEPGASIPLGAQEWEIHAAPGHDPHSVVLFEPQSRTLISADALWRNGFGVVFQELEGKQAFDEVAATLDVIAALRPATVIPGHGEVFTAVDEAIDTARRRLEAYVREPAKHAAHASKVLMKFKLLEWQSTGYADFVAWMLATPYFPLVHGRYFGHADIGKWLAELVESLVKSGAAIRSGDRIVNA